MTYSQVHTTDQPPKTIGAVPPEQDIVNILDSYRQEADNARKSGLNPRDTKWEENLDLYWNRYDFSKKAPWQARAVLPEVPMFVDRFAAAMTEALASNGDFFTVIDPADTEGDITRAISRMMQVWLSQVGRNAHGHPISFLGIFPSLMKLGALMNTAACVYWKETYDGYGYVAVEPVDPRRVWLDHTGRGMYRIRRQEIDHHELMRLARETDSSGKPLYKIEAIEALCAQIIHDVEVENEKLRGAGEQITTTRKPIIIDEYLCTLLGTDGKLIGSNQLCVVANERFLIRGPEDNPFWHKRDWLLSAPLVTVPLSVYGRSYMENFGSLARLFNDMTNLILDGAFISAMKAFAIIPEMLEDPSQADDGVYPNVTFRLDGSMAGRAQDFMKEIDLGSLPPEVVTVWSQLKDQLREAAAFNEIGLGQLAPKGRTSATEIGTAEQNSSALIRDLARTVETGFLEPLLTLVWKTGLQHMKLDDAALQNACGPEMFAAIFARRKELVERPITFQVRGISTMIARAQKLRSLIQLVGVIAQNEMLLAKFFEKVDPGKLLDQVFALQDIDIDKLALTPRERLMQVVTQLQAGGPPGGVGAPSPAQNNPVQQATQVTQQGAAG